VLVALGRALDVGPYGPVPLCPSDHAKSERTRYQVLLQAPRPSANDGGNPRLYSVPGTSQTWYSLLDTYLLHDHLM
jgi:hypothetical protein